MLDARGDVLKDVVALANVGGGVILTPTPPDVAGIRGRLGFRAWRGLHWLAYGCWPVALIHGLGTGTDRRTLWVFAASLGCVAAVAVAATWRVAAAARAGTR